MDNQEVTNIIRMQLDASDAVQSAGQLETGIRQVGDQFVFTNEQLLQMTQRYGQMNQVAQQTTQTMVSGSQAAAAATQTQTVANEELNLSLSKTKILVTDLGRELSGKGLTLRNLISTIGLLGPEVLIAGAAIGVLGYEFYKWAIQVRNVDDALNSLTDTVAKQAGKETGAVQVLIAMIRDVTTAEKARKQAIEDLIDQHPAQFRNLKDTHDILKTLKEDEENYTKAIIDNAYVKAAEAQIDKLTAENLEKLLPLNEQLDYFEKKKAQQQKDNNKFALDYTENDIAGVKKEMTAVTEANDAKIKSYLAVALAKGKELNAVGGTDQQYKEDEKDRKKAEEEEKRREAAYERLLKAEDRKEAHEADMDSKSRKRKEEINAAEEKELKDFDKLQEDYLIKSDETQKKTVEAKTLRENDAYNKLIKLATETIANKRELDSKLEELEAQHQHNLAAIQKQGEDEAAKKKEEEYKKSLKAITDFTKQEESIDRDHLNRTMIDRQVSDLKLVQDKENEIKKEIALAKQYGKDTSDLEEQLTTVKEQEAEAQINIVKSTADAIAQFAGQGTAVWKDIKIAEAIIDSLSAFSKAQSAATGYFAVQDYVNGAIAEALAVEALVQGATNVKKIENTKIPGASSSSSGSGSLSASAGPSGSLGLPAAPSTAQTTTLSQATINQLNAPIQQPVKVTVGVSEITQTQNRLANYSNHSKL